MAGLLPWVLIGAGGLLELRNGQAVADRFATAHEYSMGGESLPIRNYLLQDFPKNL
jgi:hypothetical protein